MKINNTKVIIIFFASTHLSLFSSLTYAADVDPDIVKMCDRQSIFTATKIKNASNEELSDQDIKMIRLGAVSACQDTYRRLSASNADNTSISEQETAAVAVVNEETSAEGNNEGNDKKESLLERLLKPESKEPISPAQKRHRTGGK